MSRLLFAAALAAILTPPSPAQLSATRLLTDPAISARHLAFVCDGDLWVCNRDRTGVRRLTTHKGVEGGPRFSPNGETIAFHAEYDGNTDVYVIPADGGAPRRLTFHPGADLVQGFTVDGRAVLFTSARSVYTRRYRQLFTIPLEGGQPTRLPIPHANHAAYSADGKHIAYTPLGEAFRQWKNYRGGRTSRIWVYDTATHEVSQVPQPKGRCNDTEPMWVGSRVYFLSDRDGEFNVMSWASGEGDVRRHTKHDAFPVVHASAGDGRIVYEHAGWLHVLDPKTGQSAHQAIAVRSDLIETRARFISGKEWIRNADVSPGGERAVFEFRGEIVTVPAEKGDPRNLTNTPGAHERAPVWSPDGSEIAWFSDVGGEYRLMVATPKSGDEPRSFELGGHGHYDRPRWSPDGEKVSFTDNSWTLAFVDLKSGRVTKVSTEPLYGPRKALDHAWSPDSKWIAYTRLTNAMHNRLLLYSLADRKSTAITAGLADVRHPAFDASGKYLYFAGSTDAGPVQAWFAQSNADMRMTRRLYIAVLARGTPSPLAPESDEVATEDEEKDKDEDKEKAKGENAVKVDFDGLDQRVLALPTSDGAYRDLIAGSKGQVYYIRSAPNSDSVKLFRYDLDARKEETIAPSVRTFRLSANKKKLLVRDGGGWAIVKAAANAKVSSKRLATSRIQVRIEPLAEWRQIYDEAWRINRDWFYDPGFHGANWDKMRDKYASFLPHLKTRSDLNRVIRWMCSELAVGHHRVGGGDHVHKTDRVGGGLLGTDLEIAEGRYRFATVYGGVNWNPGLRAPLTEPGVDVQAGEFLLKIDGRDLRPPENVHARLEGTSGRQLQLTVGPNPDGTGSRTVTVVPIASERTLRNRAWIQNNERYVREKTKGRVAYVYVPNTAGAGHRSFKRWFFPQADREGVIVDERHNAGGQVADYVIDILRRPLTCHWATRYGNDIKTPLASIQGPKVMLIDETAGSGGDLLPWMFRQRKLGTLIGRRTWGGLVGVLGFPELMDGGSVTAPNLAIWTEDGFIVENAGVPPDIEVEQWPKDVIAGRDPQLDRAIAEVLNQLPKSPPSPPVRPSFPKRAR
ncbi:MAG: peptidase S41 [Planctomycetes bacterium]|nr:peptidase S41 [Planctomycetota bacterium]